MDQPRDLLPELRLWADHKPITVEAWVAQVARSDEAMGFCAVLWPAFVTVGDMVLRAPFDYQRLAGWDRADHAREEIERALNRFSLTDYFHSGAEPQAIARDRRLALARTMADMLKAKLAQDFPERRFSAVLEHDGQDVGVTFFQV